MCSSVCGSCGATVFYWCDDRPEVVDVAVGLVRARGGAMGSSTAVVEVRPRSAGPRKLSKRLYSKLFRAWKGYEA